MKFDPKKHGLRSTTRFIRGTVVAEEGGKDLSSLDLAKLGQEGGQELVDQRVAVITDLKTGEVLQPEPSQLAELPADAGGGTVTIPGETERRRTAEKFVGRRVEDISDDEIAALSPEDREAAHAAETAGKARASLLARLAPAA